MQAANYPHKKLDSADKVVELMQSSGASDLYLATLKRPYLRVNGQPTQLREYLEMDEGDIDRILGDMTRDRDDLLEEVRKNHSSSFTFESGLSGRLRTKVSKSERGRDRFVVIRYIPDTVPVLESLHLNKMVFEVFMDHVRKRKPGLIVVSGETGNGKSTTLAALIELVNQSVSRIVLTIEDPIEYRFTDRECLITAREVGPATPSFAIGADDALRQNADIIMIGEMQDGATLRAALKAAEGGHLVLTTTHTPEAAKVPERLVNLAHAEDRDRVRYQLANNLIMIVGQKLIAPRNGGNQVMACEVMRVLSAVRGVLRDPLMDTASLRTAMTQNPAENITLDQSLHALVAEGRLDYDTAQANALDPETFELMGRSIPKSATGRGI